MVEEKKNELANEEEQLMGKRQVKEQHSQTTVENVLVRINKFNFPIDFATLGMEEDQHASSIGKPPNVTSQAWVDTENGEMTLLVGKEKVKFNLFQSIQLTNEEKNYCM